MSEQHESALERAEVKEEIHRERKLATAERLFGMAAMCLREARTLVGDVQVPLDLIHQVERLERDSWKASRTSEEEKA